METTQNPTTKTIGEQLKGVRKGQRLTIDGVHLGGGVNNGRVTYQGRVNGMIVVTGYTADQIFVDPGTVATVTR